VRRGSCVLVIQACDGSAFLNVSRRGCWTMSYYKCKHDFTRHRTTRLDVTVIGSGATSMFLVIDLISKSKARKLKTYIPSPMSYAYRYTRRSGSKLHFSSSNAIISSPTTNLPCNCQSGYFFSPSPHSAFTPPHPPGQDLQSSSAQPPLRDTIVSAPTPRA
jgi:hypothetical protein